MIESLRSMAMLVAVLEQGSFQAAAEEMNVSPSVLSQNIKALEERLNVTLLNRSSRKITLTQHGLALIGPAREMVRHAQAGMDVASYDPAALSGQFVVSVPTMLSSGVLADIVEDFLLTHPRVHMDLRFENTQRHPVHDGVDLTISADQIDNALLEHREVRGGGGGFFAAPDLAERIERLAPRDVLNKIPLLMSHGFGRREWVKAFEQVGGRNDATAPYRMKCDDISIIHRLCVSGAGLTVLSYSMVGPDVEQGRLVEVLKEISFEHTQFWCSWDKGSPKAALMEAFADHIRDSLVRMRRNQAET